MGILNSVFLKYLFIINSSASNAIAAKLSFFPNQDNPMQTIPASVTANAVDFAFCQGPRRCRKEIVAPS
jgi:hypothetical protein